MVDHDGFGAEGVAAVHERDVAGDVGEVEGLLDGCIAAAHNRDGLAAVEEAVARGAARDALALVLLLAFKTEVHGGGARRDDERHDAEHECKGGHQNRAEAKTRGLKGGVEGTHSLLHLLGRELHDQNGVFGREADEHE